MRCHAKEEVYTTFPVIGPPRVRDEVDSQRRRELVGHACGHTQVKTNLVAELRDAQSIHVTPREITSNLSTSTSKQTFSTKLITLSIIKIEMFTLSRKLVSTVELSRALSTEAFS